MIDMSNLFSTTSDLSLTRELSIKSLEKNQFLNNHFIADLESKTIVRISMNKIDNVGNVETLFKKYWENLSLDFISLLLDEDQISVLVNLALIMEYGSKGNNSIVPANASIVPVLANSKIGLLASPPTATGIYRIEYHVPAKSSCVACSIDFAVCSLAYTLPFVEEP